MHRRRLLALPVLFATVSLLPSLFAQSTSLGLGAQLTLTSGYYAEGLGSEIAFSGDTVVAIGNSSDAPDYKLPVYVFERGPGGWANATQTAVLTPSDATNFLFPSIAMDGSTVVVSSNGKIYIFEKPATGWKDMHEVAQISIPNEDCGAWVSGDTIMLGCSESAYIFVKPAGGWATTSTHTAKLTPPFQNSILESFAFDGDTAAMFNGRGVFVFSKPAGGWVTTGTPAAELTQANGTGIEGFGSSLAIGGDTIAVSSPGTLKPNGQHGTVDLFVKPAAGWKNMTETAEIYAPYTKQAAGELGTSVALDSEHLVVGTSTEQFYVYSKPAAGWKSGVWPSQVFIGETQPGGGPAYGFGYTVALDGATIVTSAEAAEINGVQAAGDLYVFPLKPSAIEISTDFLEYPDMTFGAPGEVLPLTITNPSASTLNFSTWISSGNFQILDNNDNTCNGGAVPAGQSCTLPIQFDPPAVGNHTNYLTLSSPSTASFRIIMLRGLAGGLGANSETPLLVEATIGSPQTIPLVLRNFGLPGSPTVSVTLPDSTFSLVSGGTCTTTGVPNGQTCTLMIEFNPITGGNYIGNIALKPSSGATSYVPITGVAFYPEGGD